MTIPTMAGHLVESVLVSMCDGVRILAIGLVHTFVPVSEGVGRTLDVAYNVGHVEYEMMSGKGCRWSGRSLVGRGTRYNV